MCLSLFNVPLRRQRLLLLCLVCALCVVKRQCKRRRPQQCRSLGVCLLNLLPWCGASDQADEGKRLGARQTRMAAALPEQQGAGARIQSPQALRQAFGGTRALGMPAVVSDHWSPLGGTCGRLVTIK